MTPLRIEESRGVDSMWVWVPAAPSWGDEAGCSCMVSHPPTFLTTPGIRSAFVAEGASWILGLAPLA